MRTLYKIFVIAAFGLAVMLTAPSSAIAAPETKQEWAGQDSGGGTKIQVILNVPIAGMKEVN